MSNEDKLKLILLYHRTENEYSILAHNQSADEAQQFTERWNPHLVEGSSLMLLDQSRGHGASDAQDCRACRETVARTAHLEPQPKYRRREEA